MAIQARCTCGAEYSLKDEFAGKAVKCRDCQGVFKVPEPYVQAEIPAAPKMAPSIPPPLPSPPPLPPPRGGYEDDEEDDRPRRGRRDRQAEDDEFYGEIDPAFQRDKFLLKQKIALTEKYYVDDERGNHIMFVERPVHIGQQLLATFAGIFAMLLVIGFFVGLGFAVRGAAGGNSPVILAVFSIMGVLGGIGAMLPVMIWLMPKRHITFYGDESKRDLLLEILQDKKFMPINATYTLLDHDGNFLARFRKNYLYNLFRRRWYCYDRDGELLMLAMEDSVALAILRRLFGPMFGVLRTNFIITRPDGERLLGQFNRQFTLLDHYVLDMTYDERGYLDRRIAIAMGLLLDTGEHR